MAESTTTPIRFQASMQHLTPERVVARDLTKLHGDDLVALDIGDDHAAISILGDFHEVVLVVAAAADKLAAIRTAREAEADEVALRGDDGPVAE